MLKTTIYMFYIIEVFGFLPYLSYNCWVFSNFTTTLTQLSLFSLFIYTITTFIIVNLILHYLTLDNLYTQVYNNTHSKEQRETNGNKQKQQTKWCCKQILKKGICWTTNKHPFLFLCVFLCVFYLFLSMVFENRIMRSGKLKQKRNTTKQPK